MNIRSSWFPALCVGGEGVSVKLKVAKKLVSTFEQLFAHTDVVFDILQHKSMDIAFCKRRIENLLQIIDELKVESVFDKIYTRAATQTEDPDVSHRAKRRLLNPRQAYRALYDAIHDSMLF